MQTDRRAAQPNFPNPARGGFACYIGAVDVRGLLAVCLPLLAGAGVAEWAIYRVFSRTFQSMPKNEFFQTVYHYGTQIGMVAVYFAAILAIATLLLLVARLGGAGLRLAAIGMMLVLFFSFASLVVAPDPDLAYGVATALDMTLLATICVLLVAYWQRNPQPLRRALAVVLGLTYATTLVANLSLSETALVLRAFVGEGLVVADAALFFAAYGLSRDGARSYKLRVWAAVAATVVAAIFTGMCFGMANIAQTAIVPILANYSLGFTMQLPLSVYIVGLWLTVYTLVACFFSRNSERIAAALSLTLLFAGGYQFYVSDQFMMALAGLALLALPEALTLRSLRNPTIDDGGVRAW